MNKEFKNKMLEDLLDIGDEDIVNQFLSDTQIKTEILEILRDIQNDESIPFEAKVKYPTMVVQIIVDSIFKEADDIGELEESKKIIKHIIGITKSMIQIECKDKEYNIGIKLAIEILTNLEEHIDSIGTHVVAKGSV